LGWSLTGQFQSFIGGMLLAAITILTLAPLLRDQSDKRAKSRQREGPAIV
jgi:hypothetical protein